MQYFAKVSTLPVPSAYGLVPLIACFAALAYGAHESLKFWLAVSQAPAPEKIVKIKVSKVKLALTFLGVMAVEFGVIFGLGMIPQFAVDCVWVVGSYAICCLITIATLLPAISKQSLVFRKNNGTFVKKFSGTSFSFAAIIAVVVATGMYHSWKDGSSIPGTIFGAFVTAGWTRNVSFPKMSIRGAIIGLMAYEIAVLLLSGAPILIPMLFPRTDKGSEEVPEKISGIFNWNVHGEFIQKLTLPFHALFMCLPGVLASLALRFDYHIHSLSTEDPLVLPVVPGEPAADEKTTSLQGVIIPTTLPSFKKPTFDSALAAILVSFVAPAVIMSPPGLGDDASSAPMSLLIGWFISVPLTSLAIIAAAYGAGKTREMWSYSETWILAPTPEPSTPEAQAAPGLEAEKALLVDLA